MRGGALPPALLAVALGFALAYAPRRSLAPCLAAFAVVAGLASLLRPGPLWTDVAFYGCWSSVVVTALSVHLPSRLSRSGALVLSLNAGAWVGAVVAAAGAPSDLARSLPFALLCLPASLLAATRVQVAIKVVASWLVAVAVLAAALPTTTPTPGYVGDHLE